MFFLPLNIAGRFVGKFSHDGRTGKRVFPGESSEKRMRRGLVELEVGGLETEENSNNSAGIQTSSILPLTKSRESDAANQMRK